MKKRRVKRRLKVGRLILVIVLGIGLAISTYFGIKYFILLLLLICYII